MGIVYRKPIVIGISGKLGSGKNYLADQIIAILHKLGYTTSETSYATALKNELTNVYQLIKRNASPHIIAEKMQITLEEAAHLVAISIEELTANPSLTGWHKTPTVRAGLQYLGTDVRRKKDNDYWVKQIDQYVDKTVDYVFIPDVRFVNEADWIKDHYDGFLYRVEVPVEVIIRRAYERDKVVYTEEQLNHRSETALDDYTRFDQIVGESYVSEEVAQLVLK